MRFSNLTKKKTYFKMIEIALWIHSHFNSLTYFPFELYEKKPEN